MRKGNVNWTGLVEGEKKKGQAIGNSLIQETGSDIHHCRRIQISWIQEARGIKTEKNRSEGNQWKSKKGETLS